MSWIGRLFERRKQDLEEELQAHIQMDIADRVSRGESLEHAQCAAQRELGNRPLIQDVTHSTWSWTRLERFQNDLRFALRVLGRSPGFSLTIVLTLAIGVGAARAMFTVVDRLLLRPLRFENPGRLVNLPKQVSGVRINLETGLTWTLSKWQRRSRAFQAISFYDENSSRAVRLDRTSCILQQEPAPQCRRQAEHWKQVSTDGSTADMNRTVLSIEKPVPTPFC